ncbi:MAG: hypothetical protein ABL933_00290 [Methyloglobulus sp.]
MKSFRYFLSFTFAPLGGAIIWFVGLIYMSISRHEDLQIVSCFYSTLRKIPLIYLFYLTYLPLTLLIFMVLHKINKVNFVSLILLGFLIGIIISRGFVAHNILFVIVILMGIFSGIALWLFLPKGKIHKVNEQTPK